MTGWDYKLPSILLLARDGETAKLQTLVLGIGYIWREIYIREEGGLLAEVMIEGLTGGGAGELSAN